MPIGTYQNLLAMGVVGAAIGIDGAATSNGNTGTASSFTLTHTTTKPNVVLVAVFMSDNNTNITGSFNGTHTPTFSGDSLTWTRRTQHQAVESDGISHLGFEIWTAVAATAGTRTTTCTLNGNMKGSDVILTVFGVFSANTTTPFDPNAAGDAFAQNMTASNTTPTVNISTNHAIDLLFQVTWGVTSGGTAWPLPSGYTSIFIDVLNNAFIVSYKALAATQTTLAVSEATTASNWFHYAAAIQGA